MLVLWFSPSILLKGLSCSYGSWIYNYLCNQFLSPLTLWVGIQPRGVVLDTTLCYKFCQWLATGRWYSPGTLVFFTTKTDRHDILVTERLLNVALNTINPKPFKLVIRRCSGILKVQGQNSLHMRHHSWSSHPLGESCILIVLHKPAEVS
jgi:hypothetical protein